MAGCGFDKIIKIKINERGKGNGKNARETL